MYTRSRLFFRFTSRFLSFIPLWRLLKLHWVGATRFHFCLIEYFKCCLYYFFQVLRRMIFEYLDFPGWGKVQEVVFLCNWLTSKTVLEQLAMIFDPRVIGSSLCWKLTVSLDEMNFIRWNQDALKRVLRHVLLCKFINVLKYTFMKDSNTR